MHWWKFANLAPLLLSSPKHSRSNIETDKALEPKGCSTAYPLQAAGCRQQTAGSRQQAACSRQQAAGSRQLTQRCDSSAFVAQASTEAMFYDYVSCVSESKPWRAGSVMESWGDGRRGGRAPEPTCASRRREQRSRSRSPTGWLLANNNAEQRGASMTSADFLSALASWLDQIKSWALNVEQATDLYQRWQRDQQKALYSYRSISTASLPTP